jgi:hypothetical protein
MLLNNFNVLWGWTQSGEIRFVWKSTSIYWPSHVWMQQKQYVKLCLVGSCKMMRTLLSTLSSSKPDQFATQGLLSVSEAKPASEVQRSSWPSEWRIWTDPRITIFFISAAGCGDLRRIISSHHARPACTVHATRLPKLMPTLRSSITTCGSSPPQRGYSITQSYL